MISLLEVFEFIFEFADSSILKRTREKEKKGEEKKNLLNDASVFRHKHSNRTLVKSYFIKAKNSSFNNLFH